MALEETIGDPSKRDRPPEGNTVSQTAMILETGGDINRLSVMECTTDSNLDVEKPVHQSNSNHKDGLLAMEGRAASTLDPQATILSGTEEGLSRLSVMPGKGIPECFAKAVNLNREHSMRHHDEKSKSKMTRGLDTRPCGPYSKGLVTDSEVTRTSPTQTQLDGEEREALAGQTLATARPCPKRLHRAWVRLRYRGPLIAFSFAVLANAVSISNVFPYAPSMVKHFNMTTDDRQLGFYAGFLMSAYQLGQLLSSFPLGALADTWGRKNIMLLGLWACTLPQILFGFSTSFSVAVSLRFAMGLPNAIVVAAKAMAPDLVPVEEQGFAMSLVSGMWGGGCIIGPALGGLLSSTGPEGSILGENPFLLPNLVGAALALASLAAVYFFIPETMEVKPLCTGSCLPRLRGSSRRYFPSKLSHSEQELPTAGGHFVEKGRDQYQRGDAATMRSSKSLCADRTWLPPTVAYSLVALTNIMYEEVLPLWAVAPVSSGGFGMQISSLGWLLSASGMALIFFQLIVLPILTRKFSYTALFTGSSLVAAVFYAASPFVGIATAQSLPMLVVVLVLCRFSSAAQFTAVFVLLNNSVVAADRGRIQGLSMAFAAGSRAVGPTLAAELFAWSLTNGMHSTLLDVHCVFLVCATTSVVTALFAQRYLGVSYNSPYQDSSH